jgi:hypothetical protein
MKEKENGYTQRAKVLVECIVGFRINARQCETFLLCRMNIG